MKLARVVFLLLCLHAGIGHAQTYVRPSDGTVVTLFTAVDLNVGGNSQIFNMSGFSGVNFYLTTDKVNCKLVPVVVVRQASSSAAMAVSGFVGPAINALFQSTFLQGNLSPEIWTVAPLSAFIKVAIAGTPNPEVSGAGNDCLATLSMIPLALAQTPISKVGFSRVFNVTSTAGRLPSTGSAFGLVKSRRVQNLSTSVVYCGFDASLQAPPAVPDRYGFALKADSGGPAGDGGAVDLPGYGGQIYCVKVGAGNAPVAVSEY